MPVEKPLTIQRLHSILRKSGFEKATRETTRIRGWYHLTEGYEISQPDDSEAVFSVTYRNDSQGYGYAKVIRDMVASMSEAISATGLEARIHIDSQFVIVRAKP